MSSNSERTTNACETFHSFFNYTIQIFIHFQKYPNNQIDTKKNNPNGHKDTKKKKELYKPKKINKQIGTQSNTYLELNL